MPSTHKLRCGRIYHRRVHKARWEAEVRSSEARGPASLSYIVVTNKRPCFKHGIRYVWINSYGCPLIPTLGHTWVHKGKKVQTIKWCPHSGQPKAGNLWTVVAMEELYFFSQTDPKFSEEPLLLYYKYPGNLIKPLWLSLLTQEIAG